MRHWRTVDDIQRMFAKMARLVEQGYIRQETADHIAMRLGIQLADMQGAELVLRETQVTYVTPDFNKHGLMDGKLCFKLLPTAMVATDAWEDGSLN